MWRYRILFFIGAALVAAAAVLAGECHAPIECNANEHLSDSPPTCPDDSCCEAIMSPARCAPRHCLPASKRQVCVCNDTYHRNESGVCVPLNECPPLECPSGETLNTCPAIFCPAEYCKTSDDSPTHCPIGIDCPPPVCVCEFNMRRDQDGICIAIRDCPPFPCPGRNEVYDSCPPVCPGETCKDYINNATCPPFRIGIVVECNPQCRCKTGYKRDENNTCIPKKDCA